MKRVLSNTKLHWRYVAVGAACGAVFVLSIYMVAGARSYFTEGHESDECLNDYPYTNRNLGCVTFDTNSQSLHLLDQKLDKAADTYTKNGKATRVSVFVRDLVTQQWAATNENEVYAPASLMKLPLLITYYKIAELDQSIFSSTLKFTSKDGTVSGSKNQTYAPANPLVPEHVYTVRELLDQMIRNSDNDAADLLYTHINPTLFEQTSIDLGVTIPTRTTEIDFVTAKTYAGIIRILYNSSYLNRDSSEAVLSLMTKTAFPGITAGVPSGINVAHKFGERELTGDGRSITRELHDCGIVYKTPNPYILCIMTQGENFDDLSGVLKGISSLVYQTI